MDDKDSVEMRTHKEFLNRTLLNRHPYFFIYRYAETRSKYKNYVKNMETSCQIKFGKSLSELENQVCYSDEEREFLIKYYEFVPVTISDSPMNLLCRYIESVQFQINQKVKTPLDFDNVDMLKNQDITCLIESKAKVIGVLKQHLKAIHAGFSTGALVNDDGQDSEASMEYREYLGVMESDFLKADSCVDEVVNILVDYFYVVNPKSHKKLLWDVFGKYIFQNIRKNCGKDNYQFPVLCEHGEIEYLGKHYQVKSFQF